MNRLLRSHTLRLALLHALVFGIGTAALLGFVYLASAGYMARQADATIAAEIRGLAEQYRARGLEGLTRIIRGRIEADPRGESVYLFASPDYRPLAGNLGGWPEVRPDDEGWIDFNLDTASGERRARARAFVLGGGLRLLVGRDVHALVEVRSLMLRAIGWGLALTVALALLAGVLTGRGTLRRIEAINATSRDIMAGDLSRRVPTRGTGDEFDRLAGNLNAMLDEIEHLMASVRDVSDNVAHDLRTPLTRLRHRLETLERALPADGEASRLTAQAIGDAEQLLTAFTALLRIARLESGGVARSFAPVDLSAVAGDACELYEAAAESRGIGLHSRLAAGCAVHADRDLLFQALANLLDNALKFTPAGGTVNVEVSRRGEHCVLAVADSGPGVPEAERGAVLRRFYRGDRSRSAPGHGLGLSLVAAVVRHHGGELELLDNRPGLTVQIRLAGAPAASTADAAPP